MKHLLRSLLAGMALTGLFTFGIHFLFGGIDTARTFWQWATFMGIMSLFFAVFAYPFVKTVGRDKARGVQP